MSNWKPLNKYFWNVYGLSKNGLPKSGHFTYRRIGQVIYLKNNNIIYKSIKNSWKIVEDKLEIIALGD